MFAVIDTNVLVSGLLSPHNPPGRIVDLLVSNLIQAVYDDRVLAEYEQVLSRLKFGFKKSEIADFLGHVRRMGAHVTAAPLKGLDYQRIKDRDDLPFAEVAAAGPAKVIVTGNEAHFKFISNNPWGIKILTPAKFMLEMGF